MLGMTVLRYFNDACNVDKVFELFVGKFAMNVDVIDVSPQIWHFLQDNFERLSEFILSHQSVDLASWPLEDRFRIAMRLESRGPLDFLRTVGLPTLNQIAQLSDADMGTALHWAAREWYRDAVSLYQTELEPTETAWVGEGFVLALLQNKPLLHALDKHGRTPLAYALDSTWFPAEDGELWMPKSVASYGCARSTEVWGMLLTDAGVSLLDYVAQENALLAARGSEDDICLTRHSWERGVALSHFVISEQQSLQLEVTTVATDDIWEFRPPPGLFPDSRATFSKICWPPSKEDGDRTCWQKTGSIKLRSKPFLWTRNHEDDLEPEEHDAADVFRVLFKRKAHDDHSALALVLGRDRRRRAHESCRRTRRSASMPPPAAGCIYRESIYTLSLWKFVFMLPGKFKRLVVPRLHKCLFDSQWGFRVPNGYSGHLWRACMQGCQGRVDYSSMFEEFLEHTAAQPKRMARELERLERIIETD